MSQDSQDLFAFWSVPTEELLLRLDSYPDGLDYEEARQRLKKYGANLLRPKKKAYPALLLLAQFNSPIILLLIFAACLSLFLHQAAEATIILLIIFISGLLGFWQERNAADAVVKLLALVQIKVTVQRSKAQKEVLVDEIVPGDVILLKAGDIVPADARILQSKDLFVN